MWRSATSTGALPTWPGRRRPAHPDATQAELARVRQEARTADTPAGGRRRRAGCSLASRAKRQQDTAPGVDPHAWQPSGTSAARPASGRAFLGGGRNTAVRAVAVRSCRSVLRDGDLDPAHEPASSSARGVAGSRSAPRRARPARPSRPTPRLPQPTPVLLIVDHAVRSSPPAPVSPRPLSVLFRPPQYLGYQLCLLGTAAILGIG